MSTLTDLINDTTHTTDDEIVTISDVHEPHDLARVDDLLDQLRRAIHALAGDRDRLRRELGDLDGHARTRETGPEDSRAHSHEWWSV